MPTVAVLAELLIVGTQALVWCYVWAVVFLGPDWRVAYAISMPESVLTLLLIALAYTLGIAIDRLADSALTTIGRVLNRGRILARQPMDERDDFQKMRLRVLVAEGAVTPYLGYTRSRLRVARSTVFNAMLLLLGLVALWLRGFVVREILLVAVGATTVALAVASWVADRIGQSYDAHLTEVDRLVAEKR